jgi:hypothetical protein
MGKILFYAFWGFFFGTVGIYFFSLFPYTEFFAWPGEWFGALVVRPDADSAEKTFTLFFSGIFYAFLFILLGSLFGKPRAT